MLCFFLMLFVLLSCTTLSATDEADNTTTLESTQSPLQASVETNTQVQQDDNSINKEITTKKIEKKDTLNSNKKEASSTVNNYDELITAVNTAKTASGTEYTINLQPGNYNATDNITWGGGVLQDLVNS